ncbi:MAG: hypothetical protein BWY09_02115 [Candidatus Hydrogenedentes bacterium ADurb.Bin179]|nr:MAG: hypothetical protein BWY09_02115 [Candidatus Hydrogenedentes bacterium ADurb.Bin179]
MGNHHVGNGNRSAILVADGHLGFGIRPQVGNLARLADAGQLPQQVVTVLNGGRHQLGCLIGSVPEHHALVACTLFLIQSLPFVDTLGNIAGLAVNPVDITERFKGKTDIFMHIADIFNYLAGDGLRIDALPPFAGNFTGVDHQIGTNQRLTPHMAFGVRLETGVQYGVGNLVTYLIRMALRHRLRSKHMVGKQLAHQEVPFYKRWIGCTGDLIINTCAPRSYTIA